MAAMVIGAVIISSVISVIGMNFVLDATLDSSTEIIALNLKEEFNSISIDCSPGFKANSAKIRLDDVTLYCTANGDLNNG
jgi:hypothetical protein